MRRHMRSRIARCTLVLLISALAAQPLLQLGRVASAEHADELVDMDRRLSSLREILADERSVGFLAAPVPDDWPPGAHSEFSARFYLSSLWRARYMVQFAAIPVLVQELLGQRLLVVWLPSSRVADVESTEPRMRPRITPSFEKELRARGYQRSRRIGPDLLLYSRTEP